MPAQQGNIQSEKEVLKDHLGAMDSFNYFIFNLVPKLFRNNYFNHIIHGVLNPAMLRRRGGGGFSRRPLEMVFFSF